MKRDIKVSLQKPNGILFYFPVFGCKLYFLPRLSWKICTSANSVVAKILFI